MTTFTVDDILSWNPCPRGTREFFEGLFSGREALTVDELQRLPMDLGDLAWLVLQHPVLDADTGNSAEATMRRMLLYMLPEDPAPLMYFEKEFPNVRAVDLFEMIRDGHAVGGNRAICRKAAEVILRCAVRPSNEQSTIHVGRRVLLHGKLSASGIICYPRPALETLGLAAIYGPSVRKAVSERTETPL